MKRLATAFLALLGACWSAPDERQAEQVIRVLTFNIHHGEGRDGAFDYERLADVITSLTPDVVALQEVDDGTRRSDGVDQTQRLEELTGMHGVFGAAMDYQGGQYGEAILSRFEIAEHVAHPLPFTDGREPRTALAARIVPDNGLPPFIFVGTHLCHQDEALRLQQTEEINRLFPADAGLPIILAGDLNSQRGSPPMEELLTGHWVDATHRQSRIDYVLIRPSDPWDVVGKYTVDDGVTSDHPAVLTVLQWEGSEAK